jgi:hypothetical protein
LRVSLFTVLSVALRASLVIPRCPASFGLKASAGRTATVWITIDTITILVSRDKRAFPFLFIVTSSAPEALVREQETNGSEVIRPAE